MQLQAALDDSLDHFEDLEFDHADLLGLDDPITVTLAYRMHEAPAKLDLSRHFRDSVANRLQVGERLPEGDPLLQVLNGLLQNKARQGHRTRAADQPLFEDV